MIDKDIKVFLNKKIKKWRYDPYSMVVEIMGGVPLENKADKPTLKVITSQQKKVLDDLGAFAKVRMKRKLGMSLTEVEKELGAKIGLSVKSGKGSGKTCLIAWIVIWFLVCFPGVEEINGVRRTVGTRVIVTAVKKEQLKDTIWAEIRKWVSNMRSFNKLGESVASMFEVLSDRVYINIEGMKDKGSWCAIGRTASSRAVGHAESLHGQHADHLLVIADEATGIPDSIMDPLLTTMSDPFNFMLMTYNPTRVSGIAYKSHNTDRDSWICHRWNCEECENLSEEYIESRRKLYGVDTDRYRINVLGLEPRGNSDSVIPLEWIMDCVDRDIATNENTPWFLGIDPARSRGGDKTGFCERQGMKVVRVEEKESDDTMEIVGLAHKFVYELEEDGNEYSGIAIDTIGVGAGVYDRLKELGQKVFSVIAHSKNVRKPDMFKMKKAELWWKARELFEDRKVSIPNNEDFIYELSNVEYEFDSSGIIQIKSKKKTGLPSPNMADAFVASLDFNDRAYENKEIKKRDRWMDKAQKTFSWMAS